MNESSPTTTFPVEPLSKAQLGILRHSLGLDITGRGRSYRHHYVAGPGHHSWENLLALVAAGHLTDHGSRGAFNGVDHLFTVTESGRARAIVPDPLPRRSKGQRRYTHWLEIADCYPDLRFKDFLTLPCFAEARANI